MVVFTGIYDFQAIPLGDGVVHHRKLHMFLHHVKLQHKLTEIEQIVLDSSHQYGLNGALDQASVTLLGLSLLYGLSLSKNLAISSFASSQPAMASGFPNVETTPVS